MKKILFVSPYYKPYFGGIERVIEKLGEELIQQEIVGDFAILTSKWSFPRRYHPDWSGKERIDNHDVFRLSSWPNLAPPFGQVPWVWFSPSEIRQMIENYRPDVIQLMGDRWIWVNFWVIFWVRQLGIPIIYSLSFHELSLAQQYLRVFNFFLVRIVDRVQIVTHHEGMLVQSTYHASADKLVKIPWGSDQKVRRPVLENTEDRLTILSVGRISHHKGQLWLAQIYQQLKLEQPSRLVLVGEIEEREVADNIRELPLNEQQQIVITKHINDDELEQWYQRAHLFVLFPEYEAFGLVFIEALQHGLPVLTHRVGAIEEVLQNCTAVTLIEPYDKLAAQESLVELTQQIQTNAISLRTEAQRFVDDHYSWQKAAHAFGQVYRELWE